MAKDKADSFSRPQDSPRRVERRGLARRVGLSLLHSREASIAIAGIVLVVYFQTTAPAFLSPGNIANLAGYAATTAIIAAGEVMVLISGEVDLSVGQVYALSPFVMYYAHEAGVPFVLAILLGLMVGSIVGIINGLLTVVLRIPSFIATLGTLFDQWLHPDHFWRFSGPAESGADHHNYLWWQCGFTNSVGHRYRAGFPVCPEKNALGTTHNSYRRQPPWCLRGRSQGR